MQAHTLKLVRKADGTASTSAPGGVLMPGEWVQLSASNYVPQKMPLQIIYPQATARQYARHKRLMQGKDYRIPIVVQGGAYPFRFQLGAATTLPGVQIGEFLTSVGDKFEVADLYGCVYGAAPAGVASYVVEVIVTGQDGATDSIQWNVDVDDSNFIFVDLNAGGANEGTETDPFNDIVSVWGVDSVTPTNVGKTAVLRDGTHVFTGHGGTGNTLYFNHDVNPCSLIAYPGETPVIDMKTGVGGDGMRFRLDGAPSNDAYWEGIIFDGNYSELLTPSGSYQFFSFTSQPFDRITWAFCTFRNWIMYHDNNAVPGSFYIQKPKGKNYLAWTKCTWDGATNGPCTTYGVGNSTIEFSVFKDADLSQNLSGSSNSGLFYSKDSGTFISVRANNFGKNVTAGVMDAAVAINNDGEGSDNVELCYNKLYDLGGRSGKALPGAEHISSWMYRNSCGTTLEAQTNWTVEKNVLTDGSIVLNGATDVGDNTVSSGSLDDDLNLVDRTDLGKVGAEIAGAST